MSDLSSHTGSLSLENIFSGNIFIFHAFDVGDDINLEDIRQSGVVHSLPLQLSKYFKNYHIPLAVQLPDAPGAGYRVSSKIHNFGVISHAYKIPFTGTLDALRKDIDTIYYAYKQQSIKDAHELFGLVQSHIKQPTFFHLRSAYVVIQIDPQPDTVDITALKDTYGNTIASIIRFETEYLSEYQRNDILNHAIGYYRGDLIIIDTEAAFLYDKEYEDILDFFEFANIQQLELKYFDRVLDQKLNTIYEKKTRNLPLTAYLPFIGSRINDPVSELSSLQVDISVITERLESSIKIADEPYYSEVYEILVDKLNIRSWRASLEKKLSIVRNVSVVYQNKIDTIREDMLSVLIITLIFIELIIGILSYMK